MSSCVHQRNLRITPAPSNLTKYAQKTLCTKTSLSRGVTGKTFTDTEKKFQKRRNATQIPTGFGNPVITKVNSAMWLLLCITQSKHRHVLSTVHCPIKHRHVFLLCILLHRKKKLKSNVFHNSSPYEPE